MFFLGDVRLFPYIAITVVNNFSACIVRTLKANTSVSGHQYKNLCFNATKSPSSLYASPGEAECQVDLVTGSKNCLDCSDVPF